jgi:hypothetical protein
VEVAVTVVADVVVISGLLENNYRSNRISKPLFQGLDILGYACKLKCGSVAILNQNPIFEIDFILFWFHKPLSVGRPVSL